ncbi:MAG: alpha/beta fold hydrolase [Polaromonas sp.]|uniref:alpha/beta hydrolase n=1 Tax=Polaromonas sp. TaxID=1869339 RepID=UPI0017ABF27A|nr:alpha/beta hydrolase [Polaromonas sp.]NMM09580.1 alpha/beta fold hydrolase [Polaromonas sp.]
MPNFWMISDRNLVLDSLGVATGFGDDRDELTYWTSDASTADELAIAINWKKVNSNSFKSQLIQATDQFPKFVHGDNERQKHVSLFIHGYNNGWQDAARRYGSIATELFNKPNGLGICISFDWPSYGSILGYYPDRDHAKDCSGDLSSVLGEVYDWLLIKQKEAIQDPNLACRAKVSVIAHSMGSYLLQKAASSTWTRKNQPLLSSLINQALMVAADVDNDLFDVGSSDALDGNALSNLSYRITSLYSGRDAVLGASAGLKNFGARRLGRSGLSTSPPVNKSNVWQVDCSSFFPAGISGSEVHSAYFLTAGTLDLMRKLLIGIDRKVLDKLGATRGTVWP